MILPIIRTKIAQEKEWPKHLSTTTFLRLAAPSLGLVGGRFLMEKSLGLIFKIWNNLVLEDRDTGCWAGVRVNLNYLEHPCSTAVKILCDLPKYPTKILDS